VRIVLDTNVLISGLLQPHGTPATVVRLALAGELLLIADERMLLEYEEVMARPRLGIAATLAVAVGEYLRAQCEMIVPKPLPVTLPDADDMPFLETAVAGLADALVTGNLKHYPVGTRVAVHICSPAELLRAMT